jgi:hypothetical protein
MGELKHEIHTLSSWEMQHVTIISLGNPLFAR